MTSSNRLFRVSILIVCMHGGDIAGAATQIAMQNTLSEDYLIVSETKTFSLQEHNGQVDLVYQNAAGKSQRIVLDWRPTHADRLSKGVVLGRVLQNNPDMDITEARMRIYLVDGLSWQPAEHPITYDIAPDGQSLVIVGEIAGQYTASLYTTAGQLLGRVPVPVQGKSFHPSRIYKPSVSGKQLIEAPIPEQVRSASVTVYEGPQLEEHRVFSIEGKWISDAIAIDSDTTILLSEGRVFGFDRHGVTWVGHPHPFAGSFTAIQVSPDGRYILAVAEATGVFYVYESRTGKRVVSRDFKGIKQEREKGSFRFLDKGYPLKINPRKRYYYPKFDVTFNETSQLLLKVPHDKAVTYYIITLADDSKDIQMVITPESKPIYFSEGKTVIYDNDKLRELKLLKYEEAGAGLR